MVGGAETGSQAKRTRGKRRLVDPWRGGGLWSAAGKAAAGWQGSSWWTGWQTEQPKAPARGNKVSNLWLKTPVGVEAAAGEIPSLTGEFVGDPQGPRAYTSPPTRESALEGPTLLVGSGGSDWKPEESRASTIAPSQTLPHVQHHSPVTSVTPPWWTPKAPPLKVTDTPRKKKSGPNDRTLQSSRKNTSKRGRDSQPITCTVQNTGY